MTEEEKTRLYLLYLAACSRHGLEGLEYEVWENSLKIVPSPS